MKVARLAALAAAALLVGFGAGLMAAPNALDPIRVAPHIYELAFENDQVRVLSRTTRNGETPPLVAQPDRVLVHLNRCAWLEDDGAGGERMRAYEYGEAVFIPANSHGGDTATVIQTCRVVEIELKTP